jgi:hypothetical protein
MAVVFMVSDFTPSRNMSIKRFSVSQKIVSSSEELNRVQSIQEKFINDNSAIQNQINDVVIKTTGTNINHKLGKKYSGFNVIKNSSNSNIFVDDSNDEARANKDKFIRLISSSDTTISIMVF